MVTLQIDDETYAALEERASESGVSVAEWLRHEVGPQQKPIDTSTKAGRRKWLERFEEYLATCKPTGFPMDDSRESIYD